MIVGSDHFMFELSKRFEISDNVGPSNDSCKM
jgi:hypothetical protein